MDYSNIRAELKELFSLKKNIIFSNFATPIFKNQNGDPIVCKTKFLQSAIVTTSENSNYKIVSKVTDRAYENASDIKKSILNSRALDYICENQEQKHDIFYTFNNDHLYYGISNSEGIFISNIEVILTFIRNKYLGFSNNLISNLFEEEIEHLKNAYQNQYLIFNPVFLENNKTLHQVYQNAVSSFNKLFCYINEESKVKSPLSDNVYFCSAFLNQEVFNNKNYFGTKTHWLKQHSSYISWLLSKFEHYSYLQIFESTHDAVQVNPILAITAKGTSIDTEVKIINWFVTNFIQYHAAKIALDQTNTYYDVAKLFDRTLGKIILLSRQFNIESPDSDRYEDFTTAVYSLIDERLSKNQKYHN